MSTDSQKHRLTTSEIVIPPGERARLVTPFAAISFAIESLMTGDNDLLYVALLAETKAKASSPGILGKLWKWWTGGDKTDPVRLIYSTEAPLEDADPDAEQPGPQEFEDFMLSLIQGGATFDASPDGTMTAVDANDQDEDDRIQLPIVHAGERLLLDVLNPTGAPISAKVTFLGSAK